MTWETMKEGCTGESKTKCEDATNAGSSGKPKATVALVFGILALVISVVVLEFTPGYPSAIAEQRGRPDLAPKYFVPAVLGLLVFFTFFSALMALLAIGDFEQVVTYIKNDVPSKETFTEGVYLHFVGSWALYGAAAFYWIAAIVIAYAACNDYQAFSAFRAIVPGKEMSAPAGP